MDDSWAKFWREVETNIKGDLTPGQAEMYENYRAIDKRAGILFLYGFLLISADRFGLELREDLQEEAQRIEVQLLRLKLSDAHRNSIHALITAVHASLRPTNLN